MSDSQMSFSKAITDIDKEYCKQEIFIKVFNYFHSAVDTPIKVDLENVGYALIDISIHLKEESFKLDVCNAPNEIMDDTNRFQYIIDYIEKRIFFIEKQQEDKHLNRLYDEFQESMKSITQEELDKAIATDPPTDLESYKEDLNDLIENLILEGRKVDSIFKASLEVAILCIRTKCENDLIRFQAICHVHRDHVKELININDETLDKIDDLLVEDKKKRDLLGTDDHRASTSEH